MSRPGARVYIQIRETGEVFELGDFNSIDTSLSIYSTSTATISITNNLDKWYTFFAQGDQQDPGTGIENLILNVHQSPRFQEINQKLAALTSQAMTLPGKSGGTTPQDVFKTNALQSIVLINEYLLFDLMYRVWIDFRGRDDLYDLNNPSPSGNLPEKWYAGFTGVISSINENFVAGKLASITLNCKDMRRFFEIAQAVSNTGVDPIWDDVANKLATMQAYTNNFSTYQDGAAVVLFLVELVNAVFCPGAGNGLYGDNYGNGAFWNSPPTIENQQSVSSAVNVAKQAQLNLNLAETNYSSVSQASAAAPDDAILSKLTANALATLQQAQASVSQSSAQATAATTGVGKKTVTRDYQDLLNITPIRDVDGFGGMTKSNSFFSQTNTGTPNPFTPPGISGPTATKFNKSDLVNYITKQDILNNLDESITDYTQMEFQVDKLIAAGNTNGASTNPYQILMNSGAFGYENQRTPASSVLSVIANYTGYNVWFDAKGNLIYQTARYDDFPNAQTSGNDDYDDPEASRGIPFLSEGYDQFGDIIGFYGEQHVSDFSTDKGSGVLAPVGIPFHGRNYIIGDESVLNWSVSRDESDALTALSIQGTPQLIPSGDVNQELAKLAATGKFTDTNLLRKFGPRYQIAPPLITSTLGGLQLLETLADGLLRRANHNIENLSLNLNCRPDLQLGRTIYFAQRRKLYYLTGIQEHFQQGEPLTTVINGQYGHLATDPIGDPFCVAFNAGLYSNVDSSVSIVEGTEALDGKIKDLGQSQ